MSVNWKIAAVVVTLVTTVASVVFWQHVAAGTVKRLDAGYSHLKQKELEADLEHFQRAEEAFEASKGVAELAGIRGKTYGTLMQAILEEQRSDLVARFKANLAKCESDQQRELFAFLLEASQNSQGLYAGLARLGKKPASTTSTANVKVGQSVVSITVSGPAAK